MRRVVVTSAVRYAIPTKISGYLRILDLEQGRVSFVTPSPESSFRTRDPNPRGGTRGTRGASVHGDRLVVANAERVFVFDTSWRLLAELSDRLMADVHDVLADERGIWVTATGTDTLLLVGWDGRLERVLDADLRDPRARSTDFERFHLNGIGRASEGLLLSFGRVVAQAEPSLEMSSVLVRLTDGGVSILHRQDGIRAPNHNVAEAGDLLVYNDSNRHCLVGYDRRLGEERCAVAIPGTPSFVRGLARIGANLWLVGSQAPLAVYAVDLDRGEVVATYPLGGIQDETVFGICPLPDEFEEPRQPLGEDPYEFWRRAGPIT